MWPPLPQLPTPKKQTQNKNKKRRAHNSHHFCGRRPGATHAGQASSLSTCFTTRNQIQQKRRPPPRNGTKFVTGLSIFAWRGVAAKTREQQQQQTKPRPHCWGRTPAPQTVYTTKNNGGRAAALALLHAQPPSNHVIQQKESAGGRGGRTTLTRHRTHPRNTHCYRFSFLFLSVWRGKNKNKKRQARRPRTRRSKQQQQNEKKLPIH